MMSRQENIVWVGIACVFIYTLATLLESCSTDQKDTPKTEINNTPASFAGSTACQSCHATEFADWKKSDHFLAMQQANDSTVKGNFNNATFVADGVTNRFFRKNGKFYINTQGEDGKNHDYEVLYTFGYFPLQQYLIAFPGGRLQSTRVSWDSREKKWFHQYAGQKVHSQDWLHWTGNSQNWNTMCASCHSTNLQKNYDFALDSYSTTWGEINVSCESCHGSGSKHIDFMQTQDYKSGERLVNAGLYYAHDTIPQQQLNTCAPCHARKTDLSQAMTPSTGIMDNMIPQIISDEFYFADGQIDDEDYEYGSFAQSKMFHSGIQCSNCHNPHSGN
ncbi:MAG: multiheme c-type cytochrome [Bacteroidota bacterium]